MALNDSPGPSGLHLVIPSVSSHTPSEHAAFLFPRETSCVHRMGITDMHPKMNPDFKKGELFNYTDPHSQGCLHITL